VPELFAHGNYEEQAKVLQLSVININYCTVIINESYNYNCIINSQYNFYIILLIKVPSGESYKEENVELTGAPNTSCFKTRF